MGLKGSPSDVSIVLPEEDELQSFKAIVWRTCGGLSQSFAKLT